MQLIEIIMPTTSWLFDKSVGRVYVAGEMRKSIGIAPPKKIAYEPPKQEEPYKKCRVCGVTRRIIDFHLSKTHKDGRRHTCKHCRNAMDRSRNGNKKKVS